MTLDGDGGTRSSKKRKPLSGRPGGVLSVFRKTMAQSSARPPMMTMIAIETSDSTRGSGRRVPSVTRHETPPPPTAALDAWVNAKFMDVELSVGQLEVNEDRLDET